MGPSRSGQTEAGWASMDFSREAKGEAVESYIKIYKHELVPGKSSGLPPKNFENWEEVARDARYRARIVALERKQQSLERTIENLAEMVEALSGCVKDYQTRPIVLPISTFAPEPYDIMGPINLVIRCDEAGFVASFAEANINASGETLSEAMAMAKDMILATFDRLLSKRDDQLGPGPLRQKQVLSQLISRAGR